MSSASHLQTSATRALLAQGVAFTSHHFPYEHKGGTRTPSEVLDLPEHLIVKTLVMENEVGAPLIVLMHGDRKVSTKALARQIGCKRISPCAIEAAQKHTGYQVGGTSPFGLKKPIPIYAERSIFELPLLYINGGSRGYAVGITPAVLKSLLTLTEVDVAQ